MAKTKREIRKEKEHEKKLSKEWAVFCNEDHPAVTPPISSYSTPPQDGENVLIPAYNLNPYSINQSPIRALCWAKYNAENENFVLTDGTYEGESYCMAEYYRIQPLVEFAMDLQKAKRLAKIDGRNTDCQV